MGILRLNFPCAVVFTRQQFFPQEILLANVNNRQKLKKPRIFMESRGWACLISLSYNHKAAPENWTTHSLHFWVLDFLRVWLNKAIIEQLLLLWFNVPRFLDSHGAVPLGSHKSPLLFVSYSSELSFIFISTSSHFFVSFSHQLLLHISLSLFFLSPMSSSRTLCSVLRVMTGRVITVWPQSRVIFGNVFCCNIVSSYGLQLITQNS